MLPLPQRVLRGLLFRFFLTISPSNPYHFLIHVHFHLKGLLMVRSSFAHHQVLRQHLISLLTPFLKARFVIITAGLFMDGIKLVQLIGENIDREITADLKSSIQINRGNNGLQRVSQ